MREPSRSVVPKWAEHDRRRGRWRPDRDDLDRLIEMNALLAAQPVPEELCRPFPERIPMLLVGGTPRSGTTLMLQLLANAFGVTYPDNVAARLWGAPYFALAVSRSLKSQIGAAGGVAYESVAGITPDAFGPHDFGYFWERFFPLGENAYVTQEAIIECDEDRLMDELAAMFVAGGRKPILFRGMLHTIYADYFSKLFKDCLFIDMHRDPADIALSMLKMRNERYGREDI